MEIWKDIKDYEGLYWISNLGLVKNKHGKILKPRLSSNGYYNICLYKNSKAKCYTVHRLVAEAFINNPDNLPEINHKDENRLNNEASNLEWCDRKYNQHYGSAIKKISKPVLCVETGIIYCSMIDASRKTNITIANIHKVCNGSRETAGGYHWIYCEQA